MKKKRNEPKKSQLQVLEKQRLSDMEHTVSADVGNFLVLLEEGSAADIEVARKKARGDLLKWGQEMQHIAQTLGGRYVKAVSEYINSIDTVLHCPTDFVDEEKVSDCFHTTRALEKML